MKVMLLAHESPQDFADREDEQKAEGYMGLWYAFGKATAEAAVHLDSVALAPPSSATVVSVRDGVRKVEDGPYPDTKEQLGGAVIIEVPDINSATQWATKCPTANTGFVEARAVMDLSGEDQ